MRVHCEYLIKFSARKLPVTEYRANVSHSLGLESITSMLSNVNDEKSNQTLFIKGRKQVNLINDQRKCNYCSARTRTLNQNDQSERDRKSLTRSKNGLLHANHTVHTSYCWNVKGLNFSRHLDSVILSKRKIFFILHIKCKCLVIEPFVCSLKYISFRLIIIFNHFSVQLTKNI